jgi:hypothetical protein
MAEAFQQFLNGEARNRARLARQCGLTRARVTQLLNMLLLSPSILKFVRTLPPGTPAYPITETALRRLLPVVPELRQTARRTLAGFAAHRAARGERPDWPSIAC